MQRSDQAHQLRDRPLVHAAGDLVQQQEARLGGERARELQALALSGRERASVSLGLLGEPHLVDQLARPVARVPHVPRAGQGTDHDVVEDAEPLKRSQLLEGAGHSAPAHDVGRQAGESGPVQPHLALVRMVEARDDLEQGRLAGAVRPDDAHQLARLNVERDPAIGDDAAEALGDAGDRQEAHEAVSAAARPRHRSPIHPTRPCGTHRTITMSAQPYTIR